ncbi:MAG: hypothetical protein HY846_12945 [Nitrosomonadales bacterium]|nr:hypothetical protein [Nitrosomonadales bacterium]
MNWELLTHPSVLFAFFGALAMQLLSLMEIRNIPKTQRPDFKDLFYWLPFIVAPLLGGGLALAYIFPSDALKPLVAINIGVSAPLILRSMANINPLDKGGINPGEGA